MSEVLTDSVSREVGVGVPGDPARLKTSDVHQQLGLGTPQARFLWRMVLLAIDLTERGCGQGLRHMGMGVLDMLNGETEGLPVQTSTIRGGRTFHGGRGDPQEGVGVSSVQTRPREPETPSRLPRV